MTAEAEEFIEQNPPGFGPLVDEDRKFLAKVCEAYASHVTASLQQEVNAAYKKADDWRDIHDMAVGEQIKAEALVASLTKERDELREMLGIVKEDADYMRELEIGKAEAEARVESLSQEIKALKERAEQTDLQLAGCGVAALGGTSDAAIATKGMYGWSASYQDVLNLRLKFERLEKALRDIQNVPDKDFWVDNGRSEPIVEVREIARKALQEGK